MVEILKNKVAQWKWNNMIFQYSTRAY